MKNKLTKFIVLAVGSLGLSSCGTVTGLGQDLNKAGNSVQKVGQGGLWGSRAAAYQAPGAQSATGVARGGLWGSNPAAYQLPTVQAPTYQVPQ